MCRLPLIVIVHVVYLYGCWLYGLALSILRSFQMSRFILICGSCLVFDDSGSYVKLCTLEFEIRRASYYWLLQALNLYQPYVWEYSRLNVSNTVMSKRKVCKHVLFYRKVFCLKHCFLSSDSLLFALLHCS